MAKAPKTDFEATDGDYTMTRFKQESGGKLNVHVSYAPDACVLTKAQANRLTDYLIALGYGSNKEGC